ncbi:hypothetical protein J6590_011236 [Homalodisca vitripennis]|nr:hypothetical protein J6590_011236 [Homalodisca vitripennis]
MSENPLTTKSTPDSDLGKCVSNKQTMMHLHSGNQTTGHLATMGRKVSWSIHCWEERAQRGRGESCGIQLAPLLAVSQKKHNYDNRDSEVELAADKCPRGRSTNPHFIVEYSWHHCWQYHRRNTTTTTEARRWSWQLINVPEGAALTHTCKRQGLAPADLYDV